MNKIIIGITGLWHLGCVLAAGFSSNGIKVIAYDNDEKRIENLKVGIPPIHEPLLEETIKNSLANGYLSFSSNINDLKNADFIWLTLDTPLDDEDNCDTSTLELYMKEFNKYKIGQNFIVSSQVPVGTCDLLLNLIDEPNAHIAYVPENFQLGKALQYFNSTDFWVIGTDDEKYAKEIELLFRKICDAPMLCSLRTAEMLKHALNSFFATIISFSNSMSELAVEMGADSYKIVEMMKKEERIGKGLPLLPGPWFSGGTLARDIRILQNVRKDDSKVTKFFSSVLDVNNTRCRYLLDRVNELKNIKGHVVSILGMIYKDGTDTLRRSPGLQLYSLLLEYGAKEIRTYDNMLKRKGELEDKAQLVFCNSLDEATNNCEIVIILRGDVVKSCSREEVNNLFKNKVVLDIPNALQDNDNLTIIKPGKS